MVEGIIQRQVSDIQWQVSDIQEQVSKGALPMIGPPMDGPGFGPVRIDTVGLHCTPRPDSNTAMSEKGREGEEHRLAPSPPPTVYCIGIVSLILVVVFWVGSGFLTQDILQDYSKPFLLCYLTNLSFMLYFVFLAIEDPVMKLTRESSSGRAAGDVPDGGEGDSSHGELPPLTHLQLAKVAFIFFALYLASNYATNVAFGTTSVGSASILAATCGFFTLVFGWAVGVEVLSVLRVLAVLISVGGVLLLGIPEFAASDTRTLGNGLALAGAVLYGLYSIFLKRIAIDESRVSMPILFAFGGLYTLLLAWPVLLALHYTGVETLELPSARIACYMLANVFLGGFIPNYLWNVAFVCTSPLVVAIGISFNIPLTLVVEYYRTGAFHWYRAASGLCVVIGFVIVNLSNIYPAMDLACERALAAVGLMKHGDIQTTEERAAKLRSSLLRANSTKE